MKIENEDLKQMVKNGEVTGFSVEGQFIDAILSQKEEDEFNMSKADDDKYNELIDKLIKLDDIDIILNEIDKFNNSNK